MKVRMRGTSAEVAARMIVDIPVAWAALNLGRWISRRCLGPDRAVGAVGPAVAWGVLEVEAEVVARRDLGVVAGGA